MTDRPAGSNARAALRTATSSIHERLHVLPPFLALSRGLLSRGDYAALLSRMAAYYFAVARHLPVDAARLALLRQDLATVDAPEPPTLRTPRPQGGGQKLGWRYAVEGSIFGGHVMYRQLDYLFGGEAAGRSFFRGVATGADRWQALCAQLESAGAVPGATDMMIEGALAAFAAFESTIASKEPAHS